MTMKKHVYIIFLAHKGVSQPHIWEKWKSMCPKEIGMTFQVYTNPVLHPDYTGSTEFCNLYRPRDENGQVFLGPTEWGSFSLVFETLKAWFRLTEHLSDEDDSMVFLVSGDDVPVKHPSVLLQSRWYNNDLICYIKYGDYWNHSQWMGCLVSSIRKYLPKLSFSIPPSDKCMRKLIILWKKVLHLESAFEFSVNCDELFLPVLDRRLPERMDSRRVSYYYMHSRQSASPIEWTSLRQKRNVYLNPFGMILKKDLVQVISPLVYDEEDVLFFRKVLPSCEMSVPFMRRLWASGLTKQEKQAFQQHQDQSSQQSTPPHQQQQTQAPPQQVQMSKRQSTQKIQNVRKVHETCKQLLSIQPMDELVSTALSSNFNQKRLVRSSR